MTAQGDRHRMRLCPWHRYRPLCRLAAQLPPDLTIVCRRILRPNLGRILVALPARRPAQATRGAAAAQTGKAPGQELTKGEYAVKFGVYDAIGLHEVLQELGTCMEKWAFYEEEAQEEALRRLIIRHLHDAEEDYHEIRELAGSGGGEFFAGVEDGWHDGTRTRMSGGRGKGATQPVQPRPTGRLSDRAMMTDLLEQDKALAVKCMWIAVEMSQQAIRHTLSNSARKWLDNAFAAYKAMERQGWYPELRNTDHPERWLAETHRPPVEERESNRFVTSSQSWQA